MSSAAERTRRWRKRQRAGRLVVRLELTEHAIELLIEAGFLRPELADHRAAISAALRRMLEAGRVAGLAE